MKCQILIDLKRKSNKILCDLCEGGLRSNVNSNGSTFAGKLRLPNQMAEAKQAGPLRDLLRRGAMCTEARSDLVERHLLPASPPQ